MAKRAPVLLAAPAALLALLAAPLARADDPAARVIGWRFTPAVALRETWTDNVALSAPAQASAALVSEAAPGFELAHEGRRLDLHATGQLHAYAFLGKRPAGTERLSHQLAASARATLVDELLFVDAAAGSGQQAISAFGPQVNGNGYISTNRAQVKTWRLSPYLRHRFGASATTEVRYSRDAVDPGTAGLGHSTSSSTSASVASGPSWQSLGWGLQYGRQQLHDSRAGASTSENALGNLRLSLGRTLALTASAGYDKFDYQSLGGRTSGRNWSGGFTWNPSLRTSFEASAGKRYFGNSKRLVALHRSRHTVWSIHYDDAVTTTRQQFLLPATIDTAAMLDRMFMPSFPDPEQRRQAVDAYMRATGVPGSLADSINYFSNRFFLQKSFQASAAFNGSRSTLLLSAFDTRRNALSAQASDSALLGASLPTLNDNTRQVGASAQANYRLNTHTGIDVSALWSRTDSLSTGLSSANQVLRVGMTHRFDRRVDGGIELRHMRGGVGAAGPGFHENAIAATLMMRL